METIGHVAHLEWFPREAMNCSTGYLLELRKPVYRSAIPGPLRPPSPPCSLLYTSPTPKAHTEHALGLEPNLVSLQ